MSMTSIIERIKELHKKELKECEKVVTVNKIREPEFKSNYDSQ